MEVHTITGLPVFTTSSIFSKLVPVAILIPLLYWLATLAIGFSYTPYPFKLYGLPINSTSGLPPYSLPSLVIGTLPFGNLFMISSGVTATP